MRIIRWLKEDGAFYAALAIGLSPVIIIILTLILGAIADPEAFRQALDNPEQACADVSLTLHEHDTGEDCEYEYDHLLCNGTVYYLNPTTCRLQRLPSTPVIFNNLYSQ